MAYCLQCMLLEIYLSICSRDREEKYGHHAHQSSHFIQLVIGRQCLTRVYKHIRRHTIAMQLF